MTYFTVLMTWPWFFKTRLWPGSSRSHDQFGGIQHIWTIKYMIKNWPFGTMPFGIFNNPYCNTKYAFSLHFMSVCSPIYDFKKASYNYGIRKSQPYIFKACIWNSHLLFMKLYKYFLGLRMTIQPYRNKTTKREKANFYW